MSNSKDPIIKNTSKRYSRMRNAIEIGLIFTALCAVPTPVQAKILFSSQFNSFSDAEVQTAVQNEVAFSEEEIQKGTQRLNKLIEYYENELTQNGKKKTQEELDSSRYIASLLKGLDRNALGKCAYNLQLLEREDNIVFSDGSKNIKFIAFNNEIIDCIIDGVNVTAEFKQGEKNLKEQLAILQSEYTENGEKKSENKINADKFATKSLEYKLITEKDLNDLYYLNDNYIVKILSGLNFLANNVNRQCDIENSANEKEITIKLNGKYLEFFEKGSKGWENKTKIMNEKLEEQRALEFQQLN